MYRMKRDTPWERGKVQSTRVEGAGNSEIFREIDLITQYTNLSAVRMNVASHACLVRTRGGQSIKVGSSFNAFAPAYISASIFFF